MKEHLRTQLASFFIIVTLIDLAMFVLGLLMQPDYKFGYEAFAYPLLYGAVGLIPGIAMYSKKELTLKQTLIRELIQMLLTIVVVIAFMFGRFAIGKEYLPQVIGVTISVIIIYVLVHVFAWLIDLNAAKKMTEDLKRFQQNVSDADK